MHFRTEIDIKRGTMPQIVHEDGIVMLGSCFTDNIGLILSRNGFDVTHNPMGPLYNPMSLLNALRLCLPKATAAIADYYTGSDNIVHCLDFASRYAHVSKADLERQLQSELQLLTNKLHNAKTLILTLGTAYVFSRKDTGHIVGNCHKIPANFFDRQLLTIEQCASCLKEIIGMMPDNIQNIIFTISPIRHIADGLHENQISKATLLMSVNKVMSDNVYYFPSYEIMIDDLRDYRFYAADMKHPSDVAIEYIYQQFSDACFTADTVRKAKDAYRNYLRAAHITINS